jgi:enterochelin esterase family protein
MSGPFSSLSLSLLLITCQFAQAQAPAPSKDQAPTRPRRMMAPPLTPPEVHPDRTVTFHLRAPNAREVTVAGGFGAPRALEKDEQGMWSVTVGPLRADVYGYSFTVDGLKMIDPSNPVVMPAPMINTSVLEVPSDPPSVQDFQDVPHGTIRVHAYQSKSVGRRRGLYVYTPPGYDQNTSMRYPVLYLLHGAGDKEGTWTALGHAHLIADNLLAQGKIRPMVIVMPDGHVNVNPPPASAAAAPVPGPPPAREGLGRYKAFEAYLLGDIIPFVETNYRIVADRSSRALAGLSMGGGQTLAIGMSHPELFAWLGSFSAAVFNPETTLGSTLSGLETSEGRPRLFWIACGTADALLPGSQKLSEMLKERNIRHTLYESEGGHAWFVWRRYLAQFLPLLFVEQGS